MTRPRSFERVRRLPVVGRVADWGTGPAAVSRHTREAGARIAGLESALILAAGLVFRYAWVGAGRESAADHAAVAYAARERGRP